MVILRTWRARAEPARRDAYPEHFRRQVAPELLRIPGFLGADLASREVDGGVEFTVCTRWASMDAVRRFAGSEHDRAVIEPGAVAVLRDFDEHVSHHVVLERVEPPGD